ncbi:hypothetical protein Leryth_026119 [Lithospermum erythrorhizon]|nr:hypothetical protein Leryth_026119 [Lithospermum erythrorhizon]
MKELTECETQRIKRKNVNLTDINVEQLHIMTQLSRDLAATEQNNELLLKSHEFRLVDSPVPEVHVATSFTGGNGRGNNKGKGKRFRSKKNTFYKNSRFKPNHKEWKSGAN